MQVAMAEHKQREEGSTSRKAQIGLYTIGSLITALTIGAVPFLRRYSGAPYVASSQSARAALRSFLTLHRKSFPHRPAPRLIDLGSGSGEIVLDAAVAGFEAKGVELNSWLVWKSRLAARSLPQGLHSSVKFEKRDLWQCALDEDDVVVVFGVPDIMQQIGEKVTAECKEECIVCSNTFEIPGWKPMKKTNGVWMYRVGDQR